MKIILSWLLIIVGIWALIGGVGYFVVIYINNHAIYFDTEIPAVIQLILGILAITYGIKFIKKQKKNANKT